MVQDLIARESSQFVSAASLRVRLDWFNKLRWGAAAGILVAVTVADLWLAHSLPLRSLLMTTTMLLLMNLGYVIRNHRLAPVDILAELRLVKVQMLGDLVVLTVLLNLTGGVENPLLYLYVVHVIMASLLFKGREIYHIAWLAIGLFTAEVVGEFVGVLPHHHLLSAGDLTHELPYITMTLASFWLVLLFCAYIGASIMTHNRSIKDELLERQAELMKADKSKMDFFRFVTHEVKSPVNTAQSAVETALELGKDSMSPPVNDMLTRAVRRLMQATDIVKDLADLTRGGLLKQDNLQVVDLSRLVNRLVARQRDVADRSGQEIVVQMPPEPVVMTTNFSVVDKIITNLVSNAVRYNSEGGRVTVTLESGSNSVRLVVADEGIGIAPEDHDRIFDEFFRSVEAQKQTTLGTGLGLAIVRKFIDELGGTIGLESDVGRGSTFTVDLPRSAIKSGKKPSKKVK
jgi:signal transduction histidine kinase